MKTLGETKEAVAKYAGDGGMCADDPRLTDLINEARKLLYPLGEWEDTLDPICLTPIYGRYVLPAKYEYAKEAYQCNAKLEVINKWFMRLDNWKSYCGSDVGLLKEPGRHVTYFDWGKSTDTRVCNPEGFWVRARFQSDRDVGTILKFKGVGVRGEDVSLTKNLTKENYDVDASGSDRRVVKLTHAVKPKTNSWIRIIGYDGTNEFDLALYEHNDINPQYTIYSGPCACQIVLKAKRRYRPIEDNDFDEVEFPDDAIIHALHAISYREASQLAQYATEIQAATAFLNKVEAQAASSSSLPIRYVRHNKNTGLKSGFAFR